LGTGKKKWQGITIAAIGILIIATVTLKILADYHIDTIVMIDLGLGIFSLVLAMYVYNKEKLLEEKVSRITIDKTHNAYLDILTNLLIFGRTLDNMFIKGYKRDNTHMEVGNSINVQLLHRTLRMVFTAHIDVIEKSIMGRLAQHISILERYARGNSVEIQQHMDNMHDMDRLITTILEKTGDDYRSEKLAELGFMRKRRHNYFMLYLLERTRNTVTHQGAEHSYADIRRKVIAYHNAILYYLDHDTGIFNQVMDELSNADRLLAGTEVSHDRFMEYSLAVDRIIDLVKKADTEMAGDQLTWVEQLADYGIIASPATFLVRTMEHLGAESTSWKHTVNVHASSILDMVNHECAHMPTESREHIVALLRKLIGSYGTWDECMKILTELNEYLALKRTKIQDEHA